MSTKITQDDVTKFSKYLIELGGAYQLDDNYTVATKDGNLKMFASGDKKKVLKIYHKGMNIGDFLMLNIFKEPLKPTNELTWFYEVLELNLAAFTKALMRRTIELITGQLKDENGNKVEASFEQMEVIGPFMKKCDKKMLDELSLLKRSQILELIFNKPKRIARLSSGIFDPSVKEYFGKKIRNKTWNTFGELLKYLFKTEDIEKDYQYKATIGGLLKCDATLHVIHKAYQSLEKPLKVISGYDVDIETFNKYIDHLERMQQLSAWLSTSSVASDNKKEKKSNVGFSKPNTPWEQSQVPSQVPGVPGFQKPNVPMVQVNHPTTSSAVPQVNLSEEKTKNEMANMNNGFQNPNMTGFSSGNVPMPSGGYNQPQAGGFGGYPQQQPMGQFSGNMYPSNTPSQGGSNFTMHGFGQMFK